MRTRWHVEESLQQALSRAMRSVVRPMWIFAICASIEAAVAQTASQPQPVMVAGKTNVQGRCKIISVAPNPDSPASERPAVFVGPADGRPEKIARPNQIVPTGSSIHTFRGGTALLELSSGTRIHLAENSELRIDRALDDGSFWLYLKVGAVRLLGLASDKTLMQSPSALATRHHTDFEMRVSQEGSTEVTVFEGVVELTNSFGGLRLDGASATNRATVLRGSAPVPVLRATNVVQWWLHFPVVLDPTELSLPLDAVRDLDDSLREYARGRYREAVVLYPEARQPTSDQERIYAAALRLVAGDPPAAEAILEQVKTMSENAAALKLLVSAVRRDVHSEPIKPTTASGWLSLSYWHQARHELAAALRAAYRSATYSPKFIAAWARATELELGREGHKRAPPCW